MPVHHFVHIPRDDRVFPYLERLQKQANSGHRRQKHSVPPYLRSLPPSSNPFRRAAALQLSTGSGGQALVYPPGWGALR